MFGGNKPETVPCARNGAWRSALTAAIGTPPPNDAARREIFAAFITQWIEKRRLDSALSREEIGALDALGRLLAQRHSLIDNLGHYFATTPRADVATGILVLITFLADNNRGSCTLSIPRMARFFNRSERAISEAIARLEQAEVLFVERLHHQSSSYWPVVHRGFGNQQTPLMWFVEARAPSAKPRGRPMARKTPEPDDGGFPENPRTQAQKPPNPASGNTTKDTTEEKRVDAQRVSFDGFTIKLFGELKQFWLDQFEGDGERMKLALIQAAGYIQTASNRPLEAQVSAQLARSVADKRDRDKRSATAQAVIPPARQSRADKARAFLEACGIPKRSSNDASSRARSATVRSALWSA